MNEHVRIAGFHYLRIDDLKHVGLIEAEQTNTELQLIVSFKGMGGSMNQPKMGLGWRRRTSSSQSKSESGLLAAQRTWNDRPPNQHGDEHNFKHSSSPGMTGPWTA